MDLSIELLTRYYCVDWIGMVATFAHLYYLGEKKWQAWIFGVIASLMWTIFSFMADSVAGVIANIVFFMLNIYGLFKWKKGL